MASMPYRHNQETPAACMICEAQGATPCRNCSGSHCDSHLSGGRCTGCESTLWNLENTIAKRVTLSFSALALTLACAASAVSLVMGTAAIGMVLVTSIITVGCIAVVNGLSPSVVRRYVRRRQLAPSSIKMLPPEPVDPNKVATPAQRRRPRHGMRPRRPRPPRAVFMTRGGYFYQ